MRLDLFSNQKSCFLSFLPQVYQTLFAKVCQTLFKRLYVHARPAADVTLQARVDE